MTSRIWSTPGTSDPPKNTITQETTVTYSTIENNVEKVNEVSNSTHVEGWPGWSVVRASTPPKLDTDPSSKKRKRKCTEGLEEEPMPQKLKGHLEHCLFESESWTPSLDASPWPETVYHLEYRRADGSLTERIVKAEPFVDSESTDLLSEHKIEPKVNQNFAGADSTNSTKSSGTQQLRKRWSLDEETSIIEKSLVPHRRRCELQANYRILDEATQQLEKMLSGMGNTKIIASQILSRLDFMKITLLACTIVVEQPFSEPRTSETWSKEEQNAFRRKFNDAVYLSWCLDDVLGEWEQLLKLINAPTVSVSQSNNPKPSDLRRNVPETRGVLLGSWRASDEHEMYLVFGHLDEEGHLLPLGRALNSDHHRRVELDDVTFEQHLVCLKYDAGALREYCRICLENFDQEPPISKYKAVADAREAMEGKRLKELEYREDIDGASVICKLLRISEKARKKWENVFQPFLAFLSFPEKSEIRFKRKPFLKNESSITRLLNPQNGIIYSYLTPYVLYVCHDSREFALGRLSRSYLRHSWPQDHRRVIFFQPESDIYVCESTQLNWQPDDQYVFRYVKIIADVLPKDLTGKTGYELRSVKFHKKFPKLQGLIVTDRHMNMYRKVFRYRWPEEEWE
ncbi:hypothetical protein ACEPPN_019438 [Leptodophora sp. 'Broadleaf-Isolate-01']